jgi:hypothetical protein
MATQVLLRLKDSAATGDGYRTWESRKGAGDLRSVIDQWVKTAGWSELVWYAQQCPAPDFSVSGTFTDAVGKLAATSGLSAELFTVDKVVVIKDSGAARCKG